jgi:hypothetical protein
MTRHDERDIVAALRRRMLQADVDVTLRMINVARLEREIEAEQAAQHTLIAGLSVVSGAPWMLLQNRITASFERMNRLTDEYNKTAGSR